MFLGQIAQSQTFSVNEYNSIQEETYSILENYNQMSSLIYAKDEDMTSKEQNYIPQFTSLFYSAEKTAIYNDLDPTHKTSEIFNPAEYAKNLILFFPNKELTSQLNLNKLRFGIIRYNKPANQFEFDMQVEKNISGWYLDDQEYKTTVVLQFKFTFNKATTLENFKIAGIRLANNKVGTDNFYTDQKWWTNQTQSWKDLLKKATGINKEPSNKDFLTMRQLLVVDKNGKQTFSNNAFNINTLVSEVVPLKKKKNSKSIVCIVLEDNIEEYVVQDEEGNIEPYSKKLYKIKARKTEEEINKLLEKYNSLILESRYLLMLENEVRLPVIVKKVDIPEKKLYVSSEAFGNKTISYMPDEIRDIILPVKRKGIYVAPKLGAGLSTLSDGDVDYKTTSKLGFSGGLELNYYFIEKIGISTGFNLMMVNYSQSIASASEGIDKGTATFTSTETIPVTTAYINRYDIAENINKTGKIINLTIPITLNILIYEEVYKRGFYINAGVLYSLKTIDKSNYTGNYQKYGYDEAANVEFGKGIDDPQMGFFTNKIPDYAAIDYKNSLYLKGSVGVIIPLMPGKHFITLGLGYTATLGSIMPTDSFTDIYNQQQLSTPKPSMIFVEMGMNFKLK